MKKIILSLLLLVTVSQLTIASDLVHVSENTTIVKGKEYVIVQTTDEEMINGIDKTTQIYLVFSVVTMNEDGTQTGKFYYPKTRSAYVVTRVYSLQDF